MNMRTIQDVFNSLLQNVDSLVGNEQYGNQGILFHFVSNQSKLLFSNMELTQLLHHVCFWTVVYQVLFIQSGIKEVLDFAFLLYSVNQMLELIPDCRSIPV